ncbi:hypothetical protein HYX09_02540 [Candidatus Woesearchaeota archaeon]|nr:hypothetical protein [Candidatus Woesearchaeota archaeon]
MLQKFIAAVELWVGLVFLSAVLSAIPFIGQIVGAIIGAVSGIPFYSYLLVLFGALLFYDGITKLMRV